MKHHTNAMNVLLGTTTIRKPTTFGHLLSVLDDEDVITCAAENGMRMVHSRLFQATQSAVAMSGVGSLDAEVPKEIQLQFEEFVVCFNDKNSNLKVSAYPN